MELLGHVFRNPALAEAALTTPAFRMDHPGASDNQRLEFLGDSVLGFLAADRLYATSVHDTEGELTVSRTHMVSTAALCAAANRHGLIALLRRNKGAEELPRNSKTLADTVEAIIGAAWLDAGLEGAREVFDTLGLRPDSPETENPKGDLQILTQALMPPRQPVYELLSKTGKPHAPVFTVRVHVEGCGEETAVASSRREAESRAAAALLSRLRPLYAKIDGIQPW